MLSFPDCLPVSFLEAGFTAQWCTKSTSLRIIASIVNFMPSPYLDTETEVLFVKF